MVNIEYYDIQYAAGRTILCPCDIFLNENKAKLTQINGLQDYVQSYEP